MEKFSAINKELKDSQKSIDEILKNFKDPGIPYKIRKIELLKSFNLPIPRSDFFSVRDIEVLRRKIEERLSESGGSLIIRFACTPDQLSMPFFYLEDVCDIKGVFEEIDELTKKNEHITHFILQQAVSPALTQNKISGRMLFEPDSVFPREQVLEIFKGARSTGILNKLDTEDKNYRRLEKSAGQFLKIASDVDPQSDISEDEMKKIYHHIKRYEPDLNLAREIIAKSVNKNIGDVPVCFEFSYLEGSLVFTDID